MLRFLILQVPQTKCINIQIIWVEAELSEGDITKVLHRKCELKPTLN